MTVASRTATKASGFVMNSTQCDGSGWVPESNMHSDMTRTEYRMRFNGNKPFHKQTLTMNHGKLPKKQLVYSRC